MKLITIITALLLLTTCSQKQQPVQLTFEVIDSTVMVRGIETRGERDLLQYLLALTAVLSVLVSGFLGWKSLSDARLQRADSIRSALYSKKIEIAERLIPICSEMLFLEAFDDLTATVPGTEQTVSTRKTLLKLEYSQMLELVIALFTTDVILAYGAIVDPQSRSLLKLTDPDAALRALVDALRDDLGVEALSSHTTELISGIQEKIKR